MSKRDDDPQSDMEVGMTTAERRRRRRRGGGLRVPSDNVPRTAKPPVVAPVPEDPSLAMSIAYSFSPEAQDPAAPSHNSSSRESAPVFESDVGIPSVIDSVIDSVSGPVEQADFEMKTREMTAVDLEALGLAETAASNRAIPRQRVAPQDFEPMAPFAAATTPGIGDMGARDSTPSIEIRFDKRPPTDASYASDPGDASDDLDVEIDGIDGTDGPDGPDGVNGAAAAPVDIADRTLDSSDGSGDGSGDDVVAEVSDVEASDDELGMSVEPIQVDEVSSAQVLPEDIAVEEDEPVRAGRSGELGVHGEPSHRQVMPVLSQVPESPVPPRTVSHEPLQPRHSVTMPPLTEAVSPPRPFTPPAGQVTSSLIDHPALRGARAQTVALSEEDLEEVREAARLASQPVPTQAQVQAQAQAQAQVSSGSVVTPAAQAPSRPTAMSMPPPMPPKDKRPSEVLSVPEIDIAALAEQAGDGSGDFEVDVEGIVDARSAPIAMAVSGPVVAPAMTPAAADPRPRNPSTPPSYAGQPSLGPIASLGAVAPLGQPAQMVAPLGAPIAVHSGLGPGPGLGSGLGPRDSQQMPIVRDPSVHSTPPPTPVAHKAPPSPPPPKKEKPAPAPAAIKPAAEPARADGKPARGKPWFVDLFDEDYLRTLPFLTPHATQAEAEFVINAMGLTPGAQVLDIGCGYGRHAMELAARGFHVVGLDMSTPLLVRGGEEAHRRGLTINFVRGDMRDLDFDAQFDGAYCLFSTFGYFDDETNKKTIHNIARALRPGGRVLIEILNRDYVIADLPTRVWWEGDGCVVLEEVELNYFSSRIQVNRSVVFDDGRQLEQEISVRAYSLHEVGKLMHAAGFRVLEVSGAYHTRGRFFGNQSRHIIVLAERKDPSAS